MATITVGEGQQYTTISAAVAASHDGDVLNVQAGTYTNDFAEIRTKITLQAVGGVVHMVATGGIPNDKGILITDTDVTIDHFEFSGATGASGNDAGIRYQGGALTLTNDYFHDNQNGLLSAAAPGGIISISNSEFAHNGAGDGYTHNLYVGAIAKLNISDSYFHDAVVGHEIKSRAAETEISNTRIFDNQGSSSYSIDLPNGGHAVIAGNTIEQGPNGENPNIIAYGEEGGLQANSSLSFTNNTVLNDLGRGTLLLDASNSPATISGTKVWGLGDAQIASGSGVSVTGTTHLAAEPALDTSHPWVAAGQVGTVGDDTLTAASGGDTLMGGAGADLLIAGSGHDALFGQAGDDRIVIGAASGGAAVYAGQGNDSVDESRSAAANYVSGDLGDDTVLSGAGDETVLGGQGNDSLVGGASAGPGSMQMLFGNQGSDHLSYAGAGGVELFGGQDGDAISLTATQAGQLRYAFGNLGADTLTATGGADSLYGGQGDDVVSAADDGGGHNYLSGDLGADQLVASQGGADTLHGGQGADTLTLTAHARGSGDTVLVGAGESTCASATDETNVQHLLGFASGSDHVVLAGHAALAVGAGGNLTAYVGGANASEAAAFTAAYAYAFGDGANAAHIGATEYLAVQESYGATTATYLFTADHHAVALIGEAAAGLQSGDVLAG